MICTEAAFFGDLARFGDQPALIPARGGAVSYRELARMTDDWRAALGGTRGLVFLAARNDVPSIAAYLACLQRGFPVYLYDPAYAGQLASLSERFRPNFVVDVERSPEAPIATREAFADLHPELRVLLSTSGSTGSTKLVRLSERNLASNAASIAQYLEIEKSDRAVTALKFNYSYGMSVINSSLCVGSSLILTDLSVSDRNFWELFREEAGTSFAGVPYTFESLLLLEDELRTLRHLRYATQAGGRLKPELVRHFAALGREMGWRFFVMYGQTEAAPRIAYLPAEQAEANPDAVGVAIPGGTLSILDRAGEPIATPEVMGELHYRGPNVMMGYAQSCEDLAAEPGPDTLMTGDLAVWDQAGLVRIVGRSSRFVKPFGLRISLDDVEARARVTVADAVVTGRDDRIVIAVSNDAAADTTELQADLARAYKLPATLFAVVRVMEMPRLPNGKIDYQAILALSDAAGLREKGGAAHSRAQFLLSRNQVITLLVSGLWHGAAWTFILWGALHGALLVLQRQVGRRIYSLYEHSRIARLASLPVQIALVFIAVAATRIFFRSADTATAITMFTKILWGSYNWGALDGKARLMVCVGVIGAVVATEIAAEFGLWRRLFRRRRALRVALACAVLLLTMLIGDFDGGRFVYVRF